ncbi:hypothetical protein MJG53_003743 [Ovis ammon polii x Ovis aries]|uniref:Uncharacterized protein n=1 Tax=Ovis ammon polii x Ovis aries TaxID=2918886 RepID=A0ACB9VIW3_9CETA|nr:hypothetical protein MJG53_003743 [Ovis ammon polii x Ovis aries]
MLLTPEELHLPCNFQSQPAQNKALGSTGRQTNLGIMNDLQLQNASGMPNDQSSTPLECGMAPALASALIWTCKASEIPLDSPGIYKVPFGERNSLVREVGPLLEVVCKGEKDLFSTHCHTEPTFHQQHKATFHWWKIAAESKASSSAVPELKLQEQEEPEKMYAVGEERAQDTAHMCKQTDPS